MTHLLKFNLRIAETWWRHWTPTKQRLAGPGNKANSSLCCRYRWWKDSTYLKHTYTQTKSLSAHTPCLLKTLPVETQLTQGDAHRSNPKEGLFFERSNPPQTEKLEHGRDCEAEEGPMKSLACLPRSEKDFWTKQAMRGSLRNDRKGRKRQTTKQRLS